MYRCVDCCVIGHRFESVRGADPGAVRDPVCCAGMHTQVRGTLSLPRIQQQPESEHRDREIEFRTFDDCSVSIATCTSTRFFSSGTLDLRASCNTAMACGIRMRVNASPAGTPPGASRNAALAPQSISESMASLCTPQPLARAARAGRAAILQPAQFPLLRHVHIACQLRCHPSMGTDCCASDFRSRRYDFA